MQSCHLVRWRRWRWRSLTLRNEAPACSFQRSVACRVMHCRFRINSLPNHCGVCSRQGGSGCGGRWCRRWKKLGTVLCSLTSSPGGSIPSALASFPSNRFHISCLRLSMSPLPSVCPPFPPSLESPRLWYFRTSSHAAFLSHTLFLTSTFLFLRLSPCVTCFLHTQLRLPKAGRLCGGRMP